MPGINSPEFSRNYGFWNEAEQQAIIDTRVAIAGVGGDGFQLGLKLARMGIQKFDIADPETFERENVNRVPGATASTCNRKKAEVFLDDVHDINPEAEVKIFTDGVTEENIDEFTSRADLIFDESELNYLEIGAAIARAARSRGIPDIMVMNIGFAAQVTSFKPDSKATFERFMGIPRDMSIRDIKTARENGDLEVSFNRCLPYIPSYGDLSTLEAVRQGASLPSIAPGVDVASALGSSQAFLHIVSKVNNRRRSPVWAPKIGYMDAYQMKSGVNRFPRFSHYTHLTNTIFHNLIGAYPEASYSMAEQKRRRDLSS